jgi:lantibiotic modifying enzyme
MDAAHPLWWTPAERLPPQIRRAFPGGAWDLGVAHGAPGVVAVLAKAHAAGSRRAGPLLQRAVDCLLAQRFSPPEAGSVFPEFAAPDVSPRSSQLAWCYGDVGIAGALSVAGLEWQSAALAVAEHAAARPVATSGVDAAHICHGSAGVAHIFNRMFQSSGRDSLRVAASEWLARLMRTWQSDGPTGDPGLLTGSAGVGLVLLAAATPVEPKWDRLLLLS